MNDSTKIMEVTDAKWYAVDREGVATLCADRKDAEEQAAQCEAMYPYSGPYRAVQLVELYADPVAYMRKDELKNLPRSGSMIVEVCSNPHVDRVAVYTDPQSAPSVSALVDALESAYNLIANYSGETLPVSYAADQMDMINAALLSQRAKQERL